MAASLPDDLLHMVCATLCEKKEFDTLYHCVLAGKQLAIPALSNLYRICHDAPVTGRGTDEVEHSTGRMTMKWASMWRSIVLSCLGKTLFPYSQFIRMLALENLHELLVDSKFLHTARIHSFFFAGDLTKYRVDRRIESSGKKKTFQAIDAETTLNRFAEDIMRQVPLLEELSGPTLSFDMTTIARNITRLSNLQSLSIFHGEALDGMGRLFNVHCPHFHSLEVYGWPFYQADKLCANFLTQLRPNSLKTFQARSLGSCNAETFLALNSHGESLENLQLEGIHADAMSALSMLGGCTNLRSLILAESAPPTQDLEKRSNDTFLELIAWLRECKKLRNLGMKNFLSGAALLTHVLVEKDIKLVSLTLDGYILSQSDAFHQALAHQTYLRGLFLSGEGAEPGDPENDILVEALTKLEHLQELQLREVSDGFTNAHIIQLSQSLPNLEEFGTSGYGIDDKIWTDMASLKRLRSLELNALSRFTTDGILDFILSLGDDNRYLTLSINMQDNDCDISEDEQAIIQETVFERLNGRFALTFWKDPDADEYSVESD